MRIVVADDDPDTVRTLRLLLEDQGHEVKTAADGPAALYAVRDFGADILLLDIGMPGMNGFEVARTLRADTETSACVLIAVSGYGQPEDCERSREVGFNHHLVKPADFSALERITGFDPS